MLTLYYKPACPFCQRVLQMAENLNVDLELQDVSDDETALATLLEKGGQKQVPFLVDSDRDTSMYESNVIIDYLREHYANAGAATAKPKIHISNSVCESCEG
jgi:glutathione S-transferase